MKKAKDTDQEQEQSIDPPTKLEIAQNQAEEYLNGWKRAKADYINFKKEQEQKQKELIEFANAGMLLDIFPLVDQFKQAMKHVPGEIKKSDWLIGVGHIQSNLSNILKSLGIEEVETVGAQFDPEIHDAVEEVESDQEKGIIVEELTTGFRLNGRVIQPAKVKVSK
ncbi:nucleotide exchange factor GrpE [Patescibacteria group bacterium]|nr:nucleotide exchange factor GrpE [Patescibacteria group bacterium]MBU1074462.1 nucleotide exchange factor GrpE [Patescibacteria group bacterium]MBU1951295.1 nucleotide exchange factor GrpE [Patescibacteria group bacterium]